MARQFASASSQYLNRGSAIVTAAPFSVSVWFKTGSTTDQVLVSAAKIADAGHRFNLSLSGSNVYAQAFDGTAGNALTSTTFTTNAWQHAGVVFASTTDRRAYLNGGGKGTNATSVSPAGINEFYAARYESGLYFDGLLAELATWNVALDDDEIAALAKGVCPLLIRPQSLVAYYPLFGNDSPEPDRWKSRFDLTLTNGPTKADHPRIYYPTNAWVPQLPAAAAAANAGAMFAVF